MVKSLFWVAVGAAGALQSERLMNRIRLRLSPRYVTNDFLDRINAHLESQRS